MSENKKINLASANDLKNNCDDRLPSVLGYDYTQDFRIVDTKLVLIYISIAISGLTFYLDKKFKNDFHNAFYYQLMIYLTATFYLFSGAVYVYSKMIEKDIKFVGVDRQKNKVTISTKLKKNFDPTYTLTVEYNDKKAVIDKPFEQLYNKDGYLQLSVFKKTITDQIDLLKKSKN